MTKVKSSLLILALFFVSQITKAQNDLKNYNFKDFDKVQIENINGEVEIEIGKSYSITVLGKNNAQKQVQITKSEDKLLVNSVSKFVTDWKNRKVVKVKIVMPAVSKLFNFSNADVSVKDFVGRYFGIENKGNGNISVFGSVVDHIEINNNGNGNLESKNIISKKVDIFKSGNGDVNIRTDTDFNVEMNGNGDIVNYGKGKAIIKKQSGTGKVVYRN
jgi:phosphoribosylformylglycinamidine (FGAM) synthase PurS component